MKEETIAKELVLGWIGNIKKEFQKEQTRLKSQGIHIQNKPVWNEIHKTMWLIREYKEIAPKGYRN